MSLGTAMTATEANTIVQDTHVRANGETLGCELSGSSGGGERHWSAG